MGQIKAKSGYGQHFLTSHKLAEKIVLAANPGTTDHFIEIGPGKGVLTSMLIEKAGFVLAYELDKRLSAALRENYRNQDNIAIMQGDFLDFNPEELTSNVKVIGNIPYNITTPILEKLTEFCDKIDIVVLTIQKEVADKLTALVGDKNYGKLTIQTWSAFEITQLFSVPRKAFSPPPKVLSRVVRLSPVKRGITDSAGFSRFISGCFSQKNRTLQNCMQIGFDWPKAKCDNILNKTELSVKTRPREVTIDKYLELFRLWQAMR